MKKEMISLEENNLCRFVQLPKGRTPVKTRRLYDLNYNSMDQITRYKFDSSQKALHKSQELTILKDFHP